MVRARLKREKNLFDPWSRRRKENYNNVSGNLVSNIYFRLL